MSDSPAESIDVDALMRLVRDEARRRSKQSGSEDVPSNDSDAFDQNFAFTAPQLFGEVAYGKDTYTIAELTSGHGEAFIRNAYRALLRRGPDPEGLGHFMGLLRVGRSKLAVLGGIRYSPEGRRLAVSVPGLYRRYLAERLFGIPVIGPMAESLAALVRIRSILLHHRALEETSLGLAQAVANASAQHSNILAGRVANVARALGKQAEHSKIIASELRAELTKHANDARRQTQRLDELNVDLSAHRTAVEQISSEVIRQAERVDVFVRRVAAIEEKSIELAAEHGAVSKRVDRLAADAGHRWSPLQDSFYTAFEDTFRGTRADIKSRISVYVPRVKDAGAGSVDAPVIDLGCGRGEWLELLRDEGLVARGCDVNGTFVDQCLTASLLATQQDLFEYLATVPDASTGAVTCFHVVEHLPFADVIHLLNEIMRVLRPGGIAVIETPNPENLRVGACDFYLDPTHRHPIPPTMLEYVVHSRGFAEVEVLRLHPLASIVDDENSDRLLAELDSLVHGPRDYAVIFRRPSMP